MTVIEKNNVDWLKVVAALSVLMSHYAMYAMKHIDLYPSVNYIICGLAGYWGPVAIFFFLSGYGLMESEKKHHCPTRLFLGKRFAKIYVPVLTVTALWMPSYFDFISTEAHPNILRLLTVDFGDGALWFIKSLLLLYVVFQIYVLLNRRNTLVGVIVFFCLTAVVQYFTHRHIAWFGSDAVMMFFIGALSSRFSDKGSLAVNVATVLLVVYAVCGYGIYHSLRLVSNILVLIAIILTCNYMYTRSIKMPNCPPLLLALSFDIYLTHNKLLALIEHYNFTVVMPVFLLISIGSALVFHILRTSLTSRIPGISTLSQSS